MTPVPAARQVAPYLLIPLAAAVLCLLLLGFASGQLLSLAISAVIFGTGALGLGFLWGQSGQLSLAHGALYGLGAYAAAIAADRLGLGFMPSLAVSTAVGAVAGMLIALPGLRTKGHYFVVLTFAVAEAIAVFENRLDFLTGGANGIVLKSNTRSVFSFSLTSRADYLVVVVVIAALVLLVMHAVWRSRWGLTLRGIRENAELAASLGVNVPLQRILAFTVSGAIAGLAGQLYLYHVRFISPDQFTAHTSIVFLLVVLVGGKEYLLGPMLGAVVYLVVAPLMGLPPVVNNIVFGALLILIIIAAPGGLLQLVERALSRVRRRGAEPLPDRPIHAGAAAGRGE